MQLNLDHSIGRLNDLNLTASFIVMHTTAGDINAYIWSQDKYLAQVSGFFLQTFDYLELRFIPNSMDNLT